MGNTQTVIDFYFETVLLLLLFLTKMMKSPVLEHLWYFVAIWVTRVSSCVVILVASLSSLRTGGWENNQRLSRRRRNTYGLRQTGCEMRLILRRYRGSQRPLIPGYFSSRRCTWVILSWRSVFFLNAIAKRMGLLRSSVAFPYQSAALFYSSRIVYHNIVDIQHRYP